MSSVQGEWRPDPTGRHEYRFWDGVRATEHVADAGFVSIDSELGSESLSVPVSRLAGGSPSAADDRRTSIEVGFGAVERQNRWTVAFRTLLLVPQAVVYFVLQLVAGILAIVGWFAALVLGRLPRGIASFLTRFVQYGTRLTAYGYLLFDRYPPFTLAETSYPATVQVRPTRLNRLAVLFRVVLMIPAVVVNQLATVGVAVASFVIWLIVLIAGRMPRALSEAVAAIVRYQTRVYGYILMVTGTYPGGLFGDKLLAADPAVLAAAPLATPAADALPPATPEAVAVMPDAVPPPSQESPRAMALVLSSAAKRLVGLFLALGLVGAVGYGLLLASAISNAATSVAVHNKVVDDYNQLSPAAQTFQSDISSCATATSPLTCEEAAYGRLATAAARFNSQLASIKVPASAQTDLATVRTTAAQFAALVTQLSHPSDPNTFAQRSLQFATVAANLDSQVQTLVNDLP